MMNLLKQLFVDEEGQGMVEYGIIIALISVVAIVAIKSIGKKTGDAYTHSSQMMDAIPKK
ncbi:MAG: Flp family type IVb pilin [Candidatus Sericytochromatia bacterium]